MPVRYLCIGFGARKRCLSFSAVAMHMGKRGACGVRPCSDEGSGMATFVLYPGTGHANPLGRVGEHAGRHGTHYRLACIHYQDDLYGMG